MDFGDLVRKLARRATEIPRKADTRTADELLQAILSQFNNHIKTIKAQGGSYRNMSPPTEVIEIERLNTLRSEIGKLARAVQLDLNTKIINGDNENGTNRN